jgi:hypothetical protein
MTETEHDMTMCQIYRWLAFCHRSGLELLMAFEVGDQVRLTVDLQIAGSVVVGDREVLDGYTKPAGATADGQYTAGGFYVERGTVGTVLRIARDDRNTDNLGQTVTQPNLDRLIALSEELLVAKQLDVRLANGFCISGVTDIFFEKA